jgi:hypothetical protein
MKLLPNLRVMAIDPGVDTGLARYLIGQPVDCIQSWQNVFTHNEFYDELFDYKPDIIVCESFDHRAKDNVNYVPVELIGLVKMYVERSGCELKFQTPSYGKSYFTAEKLKKLGLYVAGKDHVDEMMAVRHMLMFLMDNNQFDLRLLK